MTYQGVITKMKTINGSPIQYYMVFESSFLNMNQTINKKIEMIFVDYQCLNCGKNKKIFRQGFCFDCSTTIASAGEWILRPELSKAHLNIEDRDLIYEKKVQLQPHIVYLAVSGQIKVGVTRKSQIPTRWIDQGASQAIAIVEVPNRYLAGITEIALKRLYSDKTNWQKMLKNNFVNVDLIKEKVSLKYIIPKEVQEFYNLDKNELQNLVYPIINYPIKVTSTNFEKSVTISGKLIGIKAQYLIFEDGLVFNVRGNEGIVIKMKI